jgi:hypothetical protein
MDNHRKAVAVYIVETYTGISTSTYTASFDPCALWPGDGTDDGGSQYLLPPGFTLVYCNDNIHRATNGKNVYNPYLADSGEIVLQMITADGSARPNSELTLTKVNKRRNVVMYDV